MLDRADIAPVHWQMKRTPEGEAVFGEIAAELDDLDQAIRQCLLTPKGSVPLNPTKGIDLDAYRDRPLNVRHLFLAADLREALARDVPRVKVHELTIDPMFEGLTIRVSWTPTEMILSEFVVTEIPHAG